MNAKYFEINEAGCNVRCKRYFDNPRDIREAVIFLHGFGGHKDNRAAERFAEKYVSKKKGRAVITFDLPCHGDDVRKSLTVGDCFTYLTLVLRWTREQLGVERPCACCVSFGAWLTLNYLQEFGNPFRRLALRSPAVNIYDSMRERIMTAENRERLDAGKEADVGFDRKIRVTPAFLGELRERDVRRADFMDYADDILLIHGTKDEIIPVSEARSFSENNVIELREVENADHRFQDPLKMDAAIHAMIDFFTE